MVSISMSVVRVISLVAGLIIRFSVVRVLVRARARARGSVIGVVTVLVGVRGLVSVIDRVMGVVFL